MAGCVRNCCFEEAYHPWLLHEVRVVPHLLMRLSDDADEYDFDEKVSAAAEEPSEESRGVFFCEIQLWTRIQGRARRKGRFETRENWPFAKILYGFYEDTANRFKAGSDFFVWRTVLAFLAFSLCRLESSQLVYVRKSENVWFSVVTAGCVRLVACFVGPSMRNDAYTPFGWRHTTFRCFCKRESASPEFLYLKSCSLV